MFLLHYIIPLIVFYFPKNFSFRKLQKDKNAKISYSNGGWLILAGLLLGNLVDLDHVYYRLIGKVPWFQSACGHFWGQCSWNFYPLHNIYFFIIFLFFGIILIFSKNKYSKLLGWIFIGAFLNLSLDYLSMISGIVI